MRPAPTPARARLNGAGAPAASWNTGSVIRKKKIETCQLPVSIGVVKRMVMHQHQKRIGRTKHMVNVSKTLRSGIAVVAVLAGVAPVAQAFLAAPALARSDGRDLRDRDGDRHDRSSDRRDHDGDRHDRGGDRHDNSGDRHDD